ncbi:MAG: UbiD family decarboxylase domain-containing protein [Chthoniobacterales bacterium]
MKTVLPNADFVIEGYVDPREPLRDESPLGDHTGYYTLPEPSSAFHITAITHRKDAIYPATIVGMPPMEDFYIGGASVKLFRPIFKMTFPEIVDIALPAEGVFSQPCLEWGNTRDSRVRFGDSPKITKGPADVLDHATSEIAMGTKLGIDATHKLAGEGFKRPWPPLIKMSEEVRRKIDALVKTKP